MEDDYTYDDKFFLNDYYITIDDRGRIINTFSSFFNDADVISGFHIRIGTGTGSQFIAKKEVLSDELQKYADVENELPLINEYGLYQLKYKDGIISKVSDEELEEEKDRLKYSDIGLRMMREDEFKIMDKYQLTLVYDELSTEQKAELKAYRQKWLDITEVNFKMRKLSIPTRPNWLN